MLKEIGMIFNETKHGQLGNRLFYLAHLIGCSIETGHSIIDYSLDEYGKYFKGTYKQHVFSYPKQYKVLTHYTFRKFSLTILKWLKKLLNKNSKFILDHNQKEFLTSTDTYFNKIRKNNFLICDTWVDIEFLKLEKYKTEIKKIFEPKEEHLQNIKLIIKEGRHSSDMLIGIHIRKGDYRKFHNGKYYFDDAGYYAVMKKIEDLFSSKIVVFFLCSDEPINKLNYTDFKVQYGSCNIIEDLYCLSNCDYIAGPPSTYGAWASFYGDKPMLRILNINKDQINIHLEDFKICNDRLSVL